MDLEQLWAELAKLDSDDIVKGLQKHKREAFQAIHDQGHSAATGSSKQKIDAAEAAQQKAERDLEKAQERMKELEEKAPDAAAIRKQYEDREAELKKTHQEQLDAERTKRNDLQRRNARKDLVRALIGDGVDPDYAEVLVEKQDVVDRIVIGDDGELVVQQKGRTIPIAATDDHSPVELLAEELRSGIDAKWVSSSVKRGAGVQDGSGGGGGNRYQKLAEQQKEFEKARGERGASGKSAREKMGRA